MGRILFAIAAATLVGLGSRAQAEEIITVNGLPCGEFCRAWMGVKLAPPKDAVAQPRATNASETPDDSEVSPSPGQHEKSPRSHHDAKAAARRKAIASSLKGTLASSKPSAEDVNDEQSPRVRSARAAKRAAEKGARPGDPSPAPDPSSVAGASQTEGQAAPRNVNKEKQPGGVTAAELIATLPSVDPKAAARANAPSQSAEDAARAAKAQSAAKAADAEPRRTPSPTPQPRDEAEKKLSAPEPADAAGKLGLLADSPADASKGNEKGVPGADAQGTGRKVDTLPADASEAAAAQAAQAQTKAAPDAAPGADRQPDVRPAPPAPSGEAARPQAVEAQARPVPDAAAPGADRQPEARPAPPAPTDEAAPPQAVEAQAKPAPDAADPQPEARPAPATAAGEQVATASPGANAGIERRIMIVLAADDVKSVAELNHRPVLLAGVPSITSEEAKASFAAAGADVSLQQGDQDDVAQLAGGSVAGAVVAIVPVEVADALPKFQTFHVLRVDVAPQAKP